MEFVAYIQSLDRSWKGGVILDVRWVGFKDGERQYEITARLGQVQHRLCRGTDSDILVAFTQYVGGDTNVEMKISWVQEDGDAKELFAEVAGTYFTVYDELANQFHFDAEVLIDDTPTTPGESDLDPVKW
jgi:hypothetical protein